MTTTYEPKLNTAGINTLADAVEGLPYEAFEMATWLCGPDQIPSFTPNWDDPVQTALDCGTFACLAGWGCIVIDAEWSPSRLQL